MLRAGDRAKLGAVLLLAALLAGGCRKPEKFPDEPMIAFKSLAQFQGSVSDSASFVISFTDGDGDVGLDPYDDDPPFDAGSQYYHNLFLKHEYLNDGAWVETIFQAPLKYRIPRITPTGQNKALEGEIAVALAGWPYRPVGDTVRITAHMVDRSLNTSNTVVSDPVVVE